MSKWIYMKPSSIQVFQAYRMITITLTSLLILNLLFFLAICFFGFIDPRFYLFGVGLGDEGRIYAVINGCIIIGLIVALIRSSWKGMVICTAYCAFMLINNLISKWTTMHLIPRTLPFLTAFILASFVLISHSRWPKH